MPRAFVNSGSNESDFQNSKVVSALRLRFRFSFWDFFSSEFWNIPHVKRKDRNAMQKWKRIRWENFYFWLKSTREMAYELCILARLSPPLRTDYRRFVFISIRFYLRLFHRNCFITNCSSGRRVRQNRVSTSSSSLSSSSSWRRLRLRRRLRQCDVSCQRLCHVNHINGTKKDTDARKRQDATPSHIGNLRIT